MDQPIAPPSFRPPASDEMRQVTVALPAGMIAAIGRAARARGLPAGDVVCQALAAALALPPGSDAAVASAFAQANGWLDLQARLRAAGFALRLGPGQRLDLHDWPANRWLMEAELLGQSLARLTLRFRAPFPGLGPGDGPVPALPPTRPAVAAPRVAGRGLERGPERERAAPGGGVTGAA